MQCQKKKMAPCIDFVFMAFGLLLLLIAVTTSRPITRPKVFDVRSYGAKGDGKMDNTNAFTNAWKDACRWNGPSKMYIPLGVDGPASALCENVDGSATGKMVPPHCLS